MNPSLAYLCNLGDTSHVTQARLLCNISQARLSMNYFLSRGGSLHKVKKFQKDIPSNLANCPESASGRTQRCVNSDSLNIRVEKEKEEDDGENQYAAASPEIHKSNDTSLAIGRDRRDDRPADGVHGQLDLLVFSVLK